MSKCIKCGAHLPATGDCPQCSQSNLAPPPRTPSILDRDLHPSRPPAPAETRLPVRANKQAYAASGAPSSRAIRQPTAKPLPPPLPARGVTPGPIRAHRLVPSPPEPPMGATREASEAPVSTPPRKVTADPVLGRTQLPEPADPDASKTRIWDPAAQGEFKARPASWWRRSLAWLIDAAVIASLDALYLGLASAIVGIKAPRPRFSGLDAFVERMHTLQPILMPAVILASVLAIVYTALFSILWNGRTPGRLVSGIRLVDRSGSPPGPVRATVRAFLSIFSFGLFLGGFWLALFDRRGQTLHDKLTSTFVVRPV